ncbi:MAG TPA: NAD(P)/FAD-dependent oxidoreductase [Nitrospira sp.]|nr:NAD(P)/FAD-dependent oxidoreductase [Nitrospira sp.]HND01374.1 NAD(P)/FAD-dependent oxidoreductase [Nitrospira sp.]HNE34242.1 NAD(P)/FAD-dependent oxidoreductase [Nitrospira sp.]HNG55272.1 NAD(P)/FAD-dependent oxidoreductase [Nitrospira sp.]HNJ19565.1 NAD(P)/FAD-dependent oxidoreductase [Nitrospira sp.]
MAEPVADICVIGAGAAGLAAGIFAAERQPALRVEVLDGAASVGAKILVSGGGRCNVTHDVVTPEDFFGTRHLVRNVLAAFPVKDTVAWFASLGVELKREETGKLFPVTDKARTVLDALLRRSRELGVVLRPGHRVVNIERRTESEEGGTEARPGFVIRHQHGETPARRIILATGGRSLPRTGSDGGGYELVRHLGHHVTPTVPALVALMLDEDCFHAELSGLSQEVEIQTLVEGRSVDRRRGSLLWTHFGISGPVVMDASRFWCLARSRGEAAEVMGNFLPGRNAEQAREWFLAQAAQNPRRSLLKVLAESLPERYAEVLCRHAGSDPQQACAQVPRAIRDRLLEALTRFRFPVVRDRGWNFAEVTAGGIPLEEVNFRTMESKLVPGLYLVGEVLDCDGRIGGFNFQWAWATGRVAGRAAAASLGS